MAGNHHWLDLLASISQALLERLKGRNTYGENRRLRVDGVFQLVGRTVEAHASYRETQHFVSLVEDLPCRRRGVVKGLPHAHKLAALSREDQCYPAAQRFHRCVSLLYCVQTASS